MVSCDIFRDDFFRRKMPKRPVRVIFQPRRTSPRRPFDPGEPTSLTWLATSKTRLGIRSCGPGPVPGGYCPSSCRIAKEITRRKHCVGYSGGASGIRTRGTVSGILRVCLSAGDQFCFGDYPARHILGLLGTPIGSDKPGQPRRRRLEQSDGQNWLSLVGQLITLSRATGAKTPFEKPF
jgi:hypothetical protein